MSTIYRLPISSASEDARIEQLQHALMQSGLANEVRYLPGWDQAYFIATTLAAELWLDVNVPPGARRMTDRTRR